MNTPISLARRSELRARAHPLKPVVIIGDKGLTETVLAEIERALKAHELIKVKAATDERESRAAWMVEICAKLGAHPVQSIGKILVLWRENPEAKAAAPKKATQPASGKAAEKGKGARPLSKARAKAAPKTNLKDRAREVAKETTRSGRPRSRTPSPLPAPGLPRRRPRTSR